MLQRLLRIIKKIILFSLVLVTTLLLALVSLVVLIWIKPEWFINEANIKKVLPYAPTNITVSWDQLNILFDAPDFWSKHVTIKSQNLCFAYKPMLDTCLNQSNIEFDFSIENFRFEFLQISEIDIVAETLTFIQGPPTEEIPEKKPTSLPDLRLPQFANFIPASLDFSKIRKFNIHLKKMDFIPYEGKPYAINGRLHRLEITDHQELDLILQARIYQDQAFEVKTFNDILLTKKSVEIRGQTEFIHPQIKVKSSLDLKWDDSLKASLLPQITFKKYLFSPTVNLTWDQRNIDLKALNFSLASLWSQGSLKINSCSALARLDNTQGFPEKIVLDCALSAKPKHRLFKNQQSIMARLTMELSLEKSQFSLSERVLLSGQVRLEATHSLINGFVETDGEFIFKNLTALEIAKVNTHIKTDLSVPKIEIWEALLDRTKISIPSPLNALSGPALFRAEAAITDLSQPMTGSAELSTDLKSNTQRLKTLTHLNFQTIGPVSKLQGIDFRVSSDLQDIVIDAPPLALELPPQVLPDKRFILKDQAKNIQDLNTPKETESEKNPFLLTWDVKVKSSKPIRINVNVLKRFVPISVDIHHTHDRGLEGFVSVDYFPVEIFKKKADIQYVKVVFNEGSDIPGLDGLITYKNPEVDIKILILGNTQNPRIEFESKPELNRQQIVSVILFNKSLDELNEEEISSATNISRAMSDGALGLFSLIFLSSTPIQSVGYDPVSKSYTARLKIDDNTTFSMGSDFDSQRNFAVRRRLGGPWSLRTELRQTTDSSDVVVTLIEWLKRF